VAAEIIAINSMSDFSMCLLPSGKIFIDTGFWCRIEHCSVLYQKSAWMDRLLIVQICLHFFLCCLFLVHIEIVWWSNVRTEWSSNKFLCAKSSLMCHKIFAGMNRCRFWVPDATNMKNWCWHLTQNSGNSFWRNWLVCDGFIEYVHF